MNTLKFHPKFDLVHRAVHKVPQTALLLCSDTSYGFRAGSHGSKLQWQEQVT